ncbi:MAG TPA: helix-hairpin-helix domain-containing protein, partial [Thermotogota bacterium]|nr:helix-hairpin-helix domain-containing protein [Thermotogota bacterium]
MIYAIKGKIIERAGEGLIILENRDIAYEIWADKELYETDSTEVTVFTIFLPSENEWRLFGFLKKEKKAFFQLLTTVNGLGAKTAMKILYDASVREIARSILENDLTYLSTLPNVGKKTAERIVLELKSKVKQVL